MGDERQLQRIKDYFHTLDVDGDGSIGVREILEGCGVLGIQVSGEEAVAMQREADTAANQNGLLQVDDFVALFLNHQKGDGSKWGQLIAALEAQDVDPSLVLSDKQIDKLRGIFNEIDIDKNGHITAPELHLLFSKQLKIGVSLEEIHGMIAMADSSGNGRIEFKEFLKLVCNLKSSNAGLWGQLLRGISPDNKLLSDAQVEKLRHHFNQLDLDGNGHVTASELYLMFKALKVPISQSNLDQLIREADTSSNGEIEFDEFILLCCNLRSTDESAWVKLLKSTAPGKVQRLQSNANDFFGIKTEADKKDIQLYRSRSAFQTKGQSAEDGYWSQTIRGLRGKGKKKKENLEMGDVTKDPKVRQQVRDAKKRDYRPWFLLFVTLAQLGVIGGALILNGGFEKPINNVLFGPSKLTLLQMGAKYGPCMRGNAAQYALTPMVPCGVFPEDADGATPVNGSCYVNYYRYYEYFCGMGGFPNPEQPNQWWRFILPMFMHSGLIEIAFTVVFQVWKGFPIERDIGPLRMGIIYLLSGIFGTCWSANMAPDLISVSGTGPMFALLGLLYLDLFQNWPLIVSPWRWFTILTVVVVLLLGIGLLPFIDNYSHLGGFIMGVLTGLIFVPHISFGKWDGRRKKIALILAIPLVLICFLAGFLSFYDGKDTNYCKYCSVINCVPPDSAWCEAGSLSL